MSNTLNLGTDGNWGVKEDSLLGYNSENENYKPLPFDFTRASSATVVNKQGLIETVQSGIPRIDFSDDVNGALLLEPQSTNLIPYSEDFSNASWVKVAGAITSNVGVSPDGNLNADRFYSAVSASNTRTYSNYTFSAATYTFSVYAKKNGSNNYFRFSISDSSGQTFTPDFQLTNEWQRFEYTYTSTGGSGSWWVVNPSTSELSSEFDVLIYGAQLEQSSYATSYIPTQGAISTRLAETCSGGGNDQVINSTEGVLYAEISALANDLSSKYITLSDGTNSKRIIIATTGTSNQVRVQVVDTSSQIEIFSTLSNITTLNKLAFSFKQNEFKFYVNGVLEGTDTSGTVPSGLNVLKFSNADNNVPFYGNTKDVRVYNTALTDAELQALTTQE